MIHANANNERDNNTKSLSSLYSLERLLSPRGALPPGASSPARATYIISYYVTLYYGILYSI